MSPKETCIFVIDDDPSIREALSLLLRSAGYTLEVFASAEDFPGKEPFNGIGCIVLDVRMSGMSGLDLQEELAAKDSCMPIVFITGHGDIPMTVQAMKSGAVDFLPKPFDDDRLLKAIESAIVRHGSERLRYEATAGIRRRIQLLTPREYEIFRYVIAGLLNKQIAYELAIAEQTVKIHRSRIMQKLGASSLADLVRMAVRADIPLPRVG